MDELLREFLTESIESLGVVNADVVKLEADPSNTEVLQKIFRLVHTLKGTCGFIGLPRLEKAAHAAENVLGKFRDGDLTVTRDAVSLILESLDRIGELLGAIEQSGAEPAGDDQDLIARLDDICSQAATVHDGGGDPAALRELEAVANPATLPGSSMPKAQQETVPSAQSIRVNLAVIEQLIVMVSELVLTRNQLLEMVRHTDDSEFKVPLQRLSNVTVELQESVMKTRMQPIGNSWSQLPRIIRDLAKELGKKIDLQMIGAETELDRQVLELIKDPLTHMIRNSCDHGVETPADRKLAGKPEVGIIKLRAYHEGGHVLIEVSDDGRGLSTRKIGAKAVTSGIVSEQELGRMTEAQINRFIFHAGLSTATNVTNVSGRGVGMDVVRANIELIGGSIDLKSKEGRGTKFAKSK